MRTSVRVKHLTDRHLYDHRMAHRDALFGAIDAGDVARVRELLGRKPSLAAARNPQGLSAVLAARYRQHADVLEAVLAAEPRLDVFDAAAVGAIDRLAKLVAGAPELAGAWSADGFTPLHLAAFFGQAEAVQLLLDHDSPVHAVSRNAMEVQPLHAAVAGRNRKGVELLLAAGADPDARQHGGWTPLMAAAASGEEAIVSLLLSDGADVTATADNGKDAAELADDRGCHGLARRLRRGAQDKRNRSTTW